MLIAMLFRLQQWKQPKGPLIDEWVQNTVHPYDGILLSRDSILHVTTWVNLRNFVLSERSQM